MLADRRHQVRVRAGLDGDVELRVAVGDRVHFRQALAVVEGDVQVETLNARQDGVVLELHVAQGQAVRAGQLLLILQEDPDS